MFLAVRKLTLKSNRSEVMLKVTHNFYIIHMYYVQAIRYIK
jgi:hypothetical protein